VVLEINQRRQQNALQDKETNMFKRTIFGVLCALINVVIPLHAARVSLPNGELIEQQQDLRVKVLGGAVSLERTWTNGRWYFNPAWTNLKFKRDVEAAVEYVDRAGSVYERTGNQSDTYVFDDSQFIRRLVSSAGVVTWRWSNRTGAQVDYDADGVLESYSNRNGVKVSFVRGVDGRIEQVNDHFGNVALRFEYVGNRLDRVVDRSNRAVRYQWSGERLTQVTDVLGYVWKYGYDTNGQLNRIEDPEARTTTVSYVTSYPAQGVAVPLGISLSGRPGRDFRLSRVGKLKNALQQETVYQYEYNRSEERFEVVQITPAPFFRRLEMHYDLRGRLLSQENGEAMEYERRRDGELIDYVKDERGLITRTERDAYRNVVKLTFADGYSQSWKYHPSLNYVTEAVDELGRVGRYEYDDRGNLIKLVEAVGTAQERQTLYRYDEYGQVIESKRPGNTVASDVVTSYEYDGYGNMIRMTNAEKEQMQYRDFDVMGNAREQENAEGEVSKMRYNAAGWLLESESALGYRNVLVYDKVGNRSTSTVPLEGGASAITRYRYDVLNRMDEMTDPLGGKSTQQFDAEGRLVESKDARAVKTTMGYDGRGRMTTVTDGNQNVIETVYGDASNALEGLVASKIYPTYREDYLYDERDRQTRVEQVLSSTLTYTSHMVYDPVGNVVGQTDAKGRSSQRSYDALNRLTTEIDPNLGGTRYTYDDRDNVLSVTDAKGNTHTFTYDKVNRKTSETRPMGQMIRYTYDDDGHLIERISPNGAKRQYEYDADDRLITETHFLPNESTASKTHSYTYYADARGLLKTYADGKTAGSYQYNPKGEKVSETITFDPQGTNPIARTITRTYEANGLLKSVTYPNQIGSTQLTYDTNNQLQSYKIPGLAANNDTLNYSYRWNAVSQITMPGNLTRTMSLDALQRPTQIEVKGTGNSGIPVMDHRYHYDEVSNITEKTTLDGVYQYGYDVLDRLTQATPPESLQQSAQNPEGLPIESYSYDLVHNRQSSAHQIGA
jgi:YD repeat-containing protein